jgi:NAD-reducing hydrogenase large subunit
MTRRIVIDPVTRIEGEAKITVHLGDDGAVSHARFHVTEFRGFERFCLGRPFWEMPGLTARVCGICPVSHLLAAAKAGDGLLAVAPPPAADKLRRLMNLGQIIQSHALSFFHLSGPDLLLGWDTVPAKRNVFGLIAAEPELARAGIRLRQFGQEVIERLGGKKVHPAWAIPGGVRSGLTTESRDELRGRLSESRAAAAEGLLRFKAVLDAHREEAAAFGNFPSLFLGLVDDDGSWEHHDGVLRFVDADGGIIADGIDPAHYADVIGESVEPDSYLKSPYYRPLGPDAGIYRVGPLARLNVCTKFGTPLADAELAEYRQRFGGTACSSFLYHYARLVEIVGALERAERILDDPDVLSDDLATPGVVGAREAVGCSEAPRGTLFHHYQIDADGLLTGVNLIIATGQNNLAMNRTVTQIARHFVRGPEIPEAMLNRVEAGIRAFDPCLSCSTHAVGRMPFHVRLVGKGGELLHELRRG